MGKRIDTKPRASLKPTVRKDGVEVEACSLAEAVKAISGRIKNQDEVWEIKHFQEEQKGLFGMNGTKQAKIRLIKKKKP